MGENLEYSSIEMKVADLVPASVSDIEERFGQKYVSPELYLGTEVTLGGRKPTFGLVRGVTQPVLLVRKRVELEQGDWPQANEILIGRLAAAKLGLRDAALSIGDTLTFEGRKWTISGIFSAGGAAFESEIWCRLDDLQQAMKRQDLSLLAVSLKPDAGFSELDLFCKRRTDVALSAMKETAYYETLQEGYEPIRWMSWLVVVLVAGAGVFAGVNTMYGSVVGRIAELATLQTIGFVRRAIVVSLMQEGVLLAAGASLLAACIALVFVNGASVRFTMGAFALRIDSTAILIGCGVGLLLGFFGSIPPILRALRMPVVDGLKSI